MFDFEGDPIVCPTPDLESTRTLSPEQQRLDREQEQWLADQLSKQVQQEKELAELRRLQELAEARALQQGGGLGSVGIWGAPSPAAAATPPGLAQPTAGLSEQDVWLQQMQSGTAAGTIPVGFGAGAGAPDQGGAADDEYGIGSLEDALAAYGLAHLWPSMRDEEMDVDAFLMLEYDDLEDLSVPPHDQQAMLELIETLKVAKGIT